MVFLQQIYRILRHILLHHAKAKRSGFHPACHPPRDHAIQRLVGRQVHTRRALIVLRLCQHRRAHRHVHLLHARGDGSGDAEISLVEEVLDGLPDGSIHRRHAARFPAADLESLQLPDRFRLVDRNARLHVLLPVQKLLRPSLPKGESNDAY